jgi:hypothetical protein
MAASLKASQNKANFAKTMSPQQRLAPPEGIGLYAARLQFFPALTFLFKLFSSPAPAMPCKLKRRF